MGFVAPVSNRVYLYVGIIQQMSLCNTRFLTGIIALTNLLPVHFVVRTFPSDQRPVVGI